jgi:hypothetical protein
MNSKKKDSSLNPDLINIIRFSAKDILNSNDIIDALNGTTLVLTIDELIMKTLMRALDESGNQIILYIKTKNKYGHFISIIRFQDHIEVFDPYGLIYPKNTKLLNTNLDLTDLTNLFKILSLENVRYNRFHFQKLNPEINTCSRFCILRIIFKYYSLDRFHAMLGSNSDFMATALTLLIAPNKYLNIKRDQINPNERLQIKN